MSLHLRARLSSLRPVEWDGGWLLSGAVFVLALALRLVNIRFPDKIIFDETYYAKDAWSMLHHGYEVNAEGNGPAFVVHPPLGKWMIALGEWWYGNTSTGWRFSAAIVGALSVLILTRLVRRMTGSTLLGCIAGMLLSLDGLHYVLSRAALLDIFLMFWILVSLACLVIDRDQGRARLLKAIETGVNTAYPGPSLGIRWWRIAAALAIGCALATKWSALYYFVAFVLLTAAWDVGARRSAGITHPVRAALLRDWAWLVPTFAIVPTLTYLASWTGWFLSNDAWDRHWNNHSGIIGSLRGLWHYHYEMWHFHSTLHTPHSYASKPFTWLVIGRPVSFSVDYPKTGEHLYGQTCHVAGSCYSEVLAVGTPAIWWAGIAAMLVTAYLWISKRDWRAAVALVGFAAGFLPWLPFTNRTMFYFYALPLLPFEILAITLTIGLILGRESDSENRRLAGVVAVSAYVMLVLVNFAWLHPILSGDLISPNAWRARVSDWFPGWV